MGVAYHVIGCGLQELENVTAMELSLTEATRTCVNARRCGLY